MYVLIFLTSLKNVISDKLSSLRLTEDLNEHFFELKIEDTALESLFKGNDEELQLSKKKIDRRLQKVCLRTSGWQSIFVMSKDCPIKKWQLS